MLGSQLGSKREYFDRMSLTAAIELLPDRPAIEQLSRALWHRGYARGAALLVGAGFSRNARLPADDNPKPPLWSDLAKSMLTELYGEASGSGSGPGDALRLAEEYRVTLGQAALETFLKRHIRDDGWEPGRLHQQLLKLPWTDVLTTNFDTLLERAARSAPRGYDVVRREVDLALSRSPRIIKLHGTLNDGSSLIFAEEDYRTYPVKHAAFVNAARQIFIENELCLLGFSGDDPNFLQWAGWVRDNLSSQARRIYLVGVLKLHPVRRRLLEQRNIIPIDLAPLVTNITGDTHGHATRILLTYLEEAKPRDIASWVPEAWGKAAPQSAEDWTQNFKDKEKSVAALRSTLSIWQKDRKDYPRWIVCPADKRELLRITTDVHANLPLALEAMQEDERRSALFELAWRHDVSAYPFPGDLIPLLQTASTAEALATAEAELSRAAASVLLSHARSKETGVFDEIAASLETEEAPEDLRLLATYHRCLRARSQLDFAFVADKVASISGEDPVWSLRRAALLYWLGEMAEARQSVRHAARELRAHCNRDPDSISIRSRLAWAVFMAEALRWDDKGETLSEIDGHERFSIPSYDPQDELNRFDIKLGENLQKRLKEREYEPAFEAGEYRDHTKTVHFVSTSVVTELQELVHTAERVGIPHSMEHVNILRTRIANALDLRFEPTVGWYCWFLSAMPAYSGHLIQRHFGRVAVARLSIDVVDAVRTQVESAIQFWRPRVRQNDSFDTTAIEALRLFVEVLSRLCVRDDSAIAKRHVQLAVDMLKDDRLNHFWLYKPLEHLLRRAIQAVPPRERHDLSDILMSIPLSDEKGVPEHHDWPDPASYAFRRLQRPVNDQAFAARVAQLLATLLGSHDARSEAAHRLFYLHEDNQLTSNEAAAFGMALWSSSGSEKDGLPKGIELFPHAFLRVPTPVGIKVRERVYNNLFGTGAADEFEAMTNGCSVINPALRPKSQDAKRIFDALTAWRSKKEDEGTPRSIFADNGASRRNLARGWVIGFVAAPSLSNRDRTAERAERVFAFMEETGCKTALPALVCFYGKTADGDQRICTAFRQALQSQDHQAVAAAATSITLWLRLSKSDEAAPLPEAISRMVLSALERQRDTGLATLVTCAERLVTAGKYRDQDLDRLAVVLSDLCAVSEYRAVDPESRLSISASLLRAACVRLASKLQDAGFSNSQTAAWLSDSQSDPLPEVRFALDRAEDRG